MYQVSRKRRQLEFLSLLRPWVLYFSQAVFGPYRSLIYSNTYNKTQAIPYNYTYCFSIKLKSWVFINLLFVGGEKEKWFWFPKEQVLRQPSPKCWVCLPLALRIWVLISSSVKWEWKYTPQWVVDRIIHCTQEAPSKLWALPSLPLSYFPLGIRQLFTGGAETAGMDCST